MRTVGDFIHLDLASDGEINAVVLNPGREPTKVIADNGNARRYLKAAMDLPLRYNVLTQKQPLVHRPSGQYRLHRERGRDLERRHLVRRRRL